MLIFIFEIWKKVNQSQRLADEKGAGGELAVSGWTPVTFEMSDGDFELIMGFTLFPLGQTKVESAVHMQALVETGAPIIVLEVLCYILVSNTDFLSPKKKSWYSLVGWFTG